LGPFQIFTKIRETIHIFVFIAGVVETSDKMFTVSTTLAIYCIIAGVSTCDKTLATKWACLQLKVNIKEKIII
jgi:hypothetical protein